MFTIKIGENVKIIPRERYLEQIKPFIKKEIIKVLVGQRRTGKSYLLRFLAEKFSESEPEANIIFIDKDLYQFEFIKNDGDLFKYINKNLQKGFNYIFIDEIQEIENFEKVVRDLQKKDNIDIYITGSNKNIFAGELATFLSGRFIEIKVNPLSFKEFLIFNNLANNDDSLMKFLRFGGMPFLKNLELEDEIVFSYLKGIYDTIILKDLISRHNLRNVDFLIKLSEFLAENSGNLISANKISAYLKSNKINIPVNTVVNYLNLLSSTFLVDKVKRMEIKGKKIFEVNEKYYYEDLGLRNSLIGFRAQDISKIIENAVYMHLIYCGYDVKVGVINNNEIDFVATKKNTKAYIQVSYLLSDQKVLEREFGNLLQIKDNYEKIVVSMDTIPFDNYEGIKHFQLREFLLNFK
jgi:predicted AAA+ superfamily ATPase